MVKRVKLHVRRAFLVLFLASLLAPLLSSENHMVLLLHFWLPCMRFLPSLQDQLLILVQKYLHFERAWSPASFEADEIPEIQGEEYTPKRLLELSENGRKAVIVRGLVRGSKAFLEAGQNGWRGTRISMCWKS